ncbi:MAG: acyl-CoA thioesterase [Butyricicoccus sp.]
MSEYLHKVQYYETDRMGVTHHSNYIRWMEEARVAFLDEIGCNYARLESMGISSPVIGVEGDYKNSTTFDDVVHITLSVREYNGVKLVIGYEMTCNGKPVFSGTSRHCFLSAADGKILRLQRQYPDLHAALQKYAEV